MRRVESCLQASRSTGRAGHGGGWRPGASRVAGRVRPAVPSQPGPEASGWAHDGAPDARHRGGGPALRSRRRAARSRQWAPRRPRRWAVFGPVVGWSFVGTGLYAWRRRPESRFGSLMVLTGFAWFLGPLYAADSPLVFTIGIVVGALWGPLFGHVLLSFPTGRLATRARRRVVAASYVLIPLAPVPGAAGQRRRPRHHRLPGRMPAQRPADRTGRRPRKRGARPRLSADARSLPPGGGDARPPVAASRGPRASQPGAAVRQRCGDARARRRLRRPVRSTRCCGWRSPPLPPPRSLSSPASHARTSRARAAYAR